MNPPIQPNPLDKKRSFDHVAASPDDFIAPEAKRQPSETRCSDSGYVGGPEPIPECNQVTLWNSLPDEVTQRICTFLSPKSQIGNLKMACRAWSNAASFPVVNISRSNLSSVISSPTIASVARCISLNSGECAQLARALSSPDCPAASRFVELDFWGCTLQGDTFDAIADMLRVNTSLRHLRLRSTNLSDLGMNAISEALKVNCNLQTLDCRNNLISTSGTHVLSEALKSNKSLTDLSLRNNKLVGVVELVTAIKSNGTLTRLNLGHNQIGRAGSKALAELIASSTILQDIDLSNVKIGEWNSASNFADALVLNKTLLRLRLNENQLGDSGAELLAAALRSNSTLEHLDLKLNQFGDVALTSFSKALMENSTLKSLDLSCAEFSSAGFSSLAAALRVNKALNYLNLSYTCMKSGSFRILCKEGIAFNSALTTLKVKSNKLHEDAAFVLSELLMIHEGLKTIDLSLNSLEEPEPKSEPPTPSVHAESEDSSCDSDTKRDTPNEGPQQKVILHGQGLAQLANILVSNRSLTSLDLSSNTITDECGASIFDSLRFNSSLIRICLARNRLGPAACAALKRTLEGGNSTLSKVSIRANFSITEPLKQELQQIRTGHVEITVV